MGLKEALKQIDKAHGDGAIYRLGERKVLNVPVISTGSLGLDIALGIGGYPRGRIVEIYGPESSGKTTMALHAIAAAKDMQAAVVDVEHALDIEWARKIGVDVDKLLVSQPDTGEEALDIVDKLVRSGDVGIIVVDSVAALTPKAELAGEVGDSHMGLQARMMSQAMRMLTANIKRTDTLLIFINQIRHKIGVFFGSPETTTGGNALKFYASQRLDVRRIGSVLKGDEVIGNTLRVKVKKNKMAAPFRKAEFDLLFDRGIDRVGELVDLGVAFKLIIKSGSWFSYCGFKGQGKTAISAFFAAEPSEAANIRKQIIEAAHV